MELIHSRIGSHLLGKVLGVSAFTVLLCFSSLIKIPLPFTPVPVTLQNLAVLLAAAALGPRLGVCSVALYIGMGVFGVPLFANAGYGISYLFGPTNGYLFGFLFATWLVGSLLKLIPRSNFAATFMVMAAGMLSIYFFGGLWLAMGYGWDLKTILFLGIWPFVLPDTLKAFAAAAVCCRLK